MRALVTGGAGFIGSAVAGRLIDTGWEVRVLDSFLTGEKEAVPASSDLLHGDVRDPDIVRYACRSVDVIFHLAGLDSVPRSMEDPVETHKCNADGTLNVLVAAEEQGARRVVYASSASIYGDTPDAVIHEDSPKRPISPFAVSKLAAEHYCRVWSNLKGLPTVSLRYFNVFGPGQRANARYAPVIPSFVAAVREVRPPEIHGDGEQTRDFVYIRDVVDATLLSADADSRIDGETINVGSGTCKTIQEVLRSVCEITGRSMEPVLTEPRVADIRRTHADISKARDLLEWSPATAWTDALRATVNWFDRSLQA